MIQTLKENLKAEIKQAVLTCGYITESDDLNVILENTNNKYADYTKIRNDIREKVGTYLYKATQCKPVILTVIQEI